MTAAEPFVFDLRLPGLTLDSQAVVDPHVVRAWWWGPKEDPRQAFARKAAPASEALGEVVMRRKRGLEAMPRLGAPPLSKEAEPPTVVVVHALTGDMRAGGDEGWWSPMIGPGRPLDPEAVRVLSFNNLGSCYGTSGPADEGFPVTPITPWDQARSLLLALDALGIGTVDLVTGGSLGGMITLCLAALAPERFLRMMPIATSVAASSWIVGFNHVQREIIRMDPGFPGHIGRGLELARQIAMLTYRAEPGLELRQGRQPADPGTAFGFRMQTYLEHQGKKLRQRFDGWAYLAMLDAMDHHDLERRPSGPEPFESWTVDERPWSGLDRISASTMAIGIDSDELFFFEHSQGLVKALESRGLWAELGTLTSPHGHDAFLIEWDQLAPLLRRALRLPLE